MRTVLRGSVGFVDGSTGATGVTDDQLTRRNGCVAGVGRVLSHFEIVGNSLNFKII